MRTITVEKNNLINILETNKKKHVEEFNATWSGYKEDVLIWMEKEIENIKNDEKFDVSFLGSMPYSNEEDYDRVLGMLKLSIDSEVELTMEEYSKYVQDNWDWKQHFSTLNAMYAKV